MSTSVSTIELITFGYIRSNILTNNNHQLPYPIVHSIARFVKETANLLIMIMGSNSTLYQNISTLNTTTLTSNKINMNNFTYNDIISHTNYCKFQIPKTQIPHWITNKLDNIYSDQLIGFFSIGGYNKTQKIEHTDCDLFVFDGLNIINNNYNTLHHINLPSLQKSDNTYSFNPYSSIFHDNKLLLFNEINTIKILNIYDLKWKDYKINWKLPRSDMSLCNISNNKILLLGGQNDCMFTGNVDLFDMTHTENYKITSLNAMNYSRLHCGNIFDNKLNRMIVVGGFGGASFEKDPMNSSKSMEIYDFEKNKWNLNDKLTNYEHENGCLFIDKNNPNILIITGNHPDPIFYNRMNDGYIEYVDLRDPFPKYKWNLLSQKSLVQMFNVTDNCINNLKWRCNKIIHI
eukprot:166057_1